jgi:FtsH-binding integral membrane protein
LERGAAGLAFALVGYGLLLTASRGGWVAVAACAGLALLAWAGRRVAPDRWLAGLLGLFVLALLGAVVLALLGPERVPGLSSAISRAEDRGELYVNSLHLLREYPLTGTGLGDTFAMVYSKYILLIPHAYLTYAHNLPIAVWMNQGLLGLLSLCWLLLAFYAQAARLARRGQGGPLLWGAVAGATVMLLHGLTDAPEYTGDRWVMLALFGLLGLGVALGRPFVERRPLGARRLALTALVLVVLGGVGVFFLRDDFRANLCALEHTRSELDPDLAEPQRERMRFNAKLDCQMALDINSQHPAANWRLGLMALNADDFDLAVKHLEIAWKAMPGHRGVQKALGLAYLWQGQIELAQEKLAPLEEMVQELDTWSWWRGEQGQDDLSAYAQELHLRLKGEQ